MELEGTVQNGVLVWDEPPTLSDGTRVVVTVRDVMPAAVQSPVQDQTAAKPKTLGERLEKYRGACPGLPEDMAAQHDCR